MTNVIQQQAILHAGKKQYHCPKCKNEVTERIRRSPFVKTFLFWLSIKRFYCFSCKTRRYYFS